MSNEERFCIAAWDWFRKRRKTQPTGQEFDLCECKAEGLLRFCHHEFEKNVVTKATGWARHGRQAYNHSTFR